MNRTVLLCLFLLVFLFGCGEGNAEYTISPNETEMIIESEKERTEELTKEAGVVEYNLTLMVGDTIVPVKWEENPSVAELTERAARKAMEIEMTMYGGWEQVGSLGYSISRNDVQMTALSGDIMLYSGNQIVLFYGENTWAYTKLGHMDLSKNEITTLLSGGAVSITLAVQ